MTQTSAGLQVDLPGRGERSDSRALRLGKLEAATQAGKAAPMTREIDAASGAERRKLAAFVALPAVGTPRH